MYLLWSNKLFKLAVDGGGVIAKGIIHKHRVIEKLQSVFLKKRNFQSMYVRKYIKWGLPEDTYI